MIFSHYQKAFIPKVASLIIQSAVRWIREKKGWIFKSVQQICQLGFNCRNCLQKDATDKTEERGKQNYTFPACLNLNLVYGKKGHYSILIGSRLFPGGRGVTQQTQGGSAPRSDILHSYIPFMTVLCAGTNTNTLINLTNLIKPILEGFVRSHPSITLLIFHHQLAL